MIKGNAMIKHIVMWKFKDTANGHDKKTNLEITKNILEEMKTKIPVIQSIEVGINYNTNEDAYDLVLITDFKDKKDLQIYKDHPEHVRIKTHFQKVRDEKKVVDFEY